MKNTICFLLLCVSTIFSQVNINGNDVTLYQFDSDNMSDNDIIIFSSGENVKVSDGKLKLLPVFKNNIVRTRLRSKVMNGSEIVLKIDNLPFNGVGNIKLLTSDNNFIQLKFYDNEGSKSIVVSEKILSAQENYIYRKITPISTPVLFKIHLQKDKTVFSIGYAGRSFNNIFETDLSLDNAMIQLEASSRVDNYHTGIDIDWIIVSTKK
ncbi:MAG: hypothetical protein KAS62_05250 [Candidatus Delongbacteria bacterium]|nr:hypothetical protein [Candidatus Delongbacteria bacterium]